MRKEDKIKKFRELAIRRTNNVLKQVRILGNLSNRNAYEYTEEEISKIFSEVDKRIKETRAKFHFSSDKKFNL